MINSKQKIVIQNRDHLDKVIEGHIQAFGNEVDLNHLDVSNVVNMAVLFANSNSKFNGNISNWNLSNVENMRHMFAGSLFNGDISQWNVSKVKNMKGLFYNTQFNGQISEWNTSSVKNMEEMFSHSQFNQDISHWDVSNVENMGTIFYQSEFNQDLTLWTPINLENSLDVFSHSQCQKPYWAECKTNQELVQTIKEYQDNLKLKHKLDDELIINHTNQKIKL
jgi:hypothetical protein